MKDQLGGKLYVVATPLGNVKDMTYRAVEVLQSVDRIAAEDTRHSGPLLKHYHIQKPMLSLHQFNERERSATLLDYLLAGEAVALISDAGTPLISDPGYYLVRDAKAAGITVIPIPGPCAAIAALSVSGLETDRFRFEGFLPAKGEARTERLMALRHEGLTLIFYEAPHRLLATLKNMVAVFGENRLASVARELTKIYETVKTEPLAALLTYYESHADEVRGECVILVQGIEKESSPSKEVIPHEVLHILLAALPLKQAVQLTSQITGERKNTVYEWALSEKGKT